MPTYMLMQNDRCQYECIHCGNQIQDLFKKYSATVLKLTECQNCKNIADKYIEYDPVIVMIDLVLLNEQAYRHILWNTGFEGHWKLAAVLLLAETYCEWVSMKKQYSPLSNGGYKSTELMFEGEKYFYITCLQVLFGHMLLLATVLAVTKLYWIVFPKKYQENFTFLIFWKAFVLSNFGKFLTVAELIWDGNGNGITSSFVAIYVYLSQLHSYSVISKTSKTVAGFVVLLGFFTKTIITESETLHVQLYKYAM
ncbi:protein ARV1 isoform X1 [Schistocerca serialis cubense]|uniref:protein ARV1 isoform X1 n=2 Tax=Schistocerca serialis cubense TaxID=2023355 RepID=UPI00214F37A7|nr:protein ARV1 isoform X1 [Schistocerca serialis cubense]